MENFIKINNLNYCGKDYVKLQSFIIIFLCTIIFKYHGYKKIKNTDSV